MNKLLFFLSGLIISCHITAQHPADNYNVVSLSNLNLNRTATKLTAAQNNSYPHSDWGFRWNSGDNSTLNWRPQGITGIKSSTLNFIVVSWYGRSDYGYEDRGARISFVDISDQNNLSYRHVLLVDENYNTFPDLHAGGLAYINDTLYVPDSRSGNKFILRFDINQIKQVPAADLGNFYNYGYILQLVSTDTVPIKPSFLSYDWDSQELVTGSFNNCGTPYCSPNTSNTLAWQSIGNFSNASPYYSGFFGKMQGVGSINHPNNANKIIWVSTSYGRSNNSNLYISNFDPGQNNSQAQPVSLGQNYQQITYPPGLEDIHITPQSDTLWTLTEFGTNEGSNNNRDVFAIPIQSILPTNICQDSTELPQDLIQDIFKCTIDTISYAASTNYVSYASFHSSENEWININSTAPYISNTNRSVFMWVRIPSISSTEVLFGANTSTYGNISNLQIGNNGTLQIYDGSSSHSGTTNIADGQWHHVGYSYNESTNQTLIYVDGQQEVNFNNSQTISTTSLISLGQEFDSGNTISNLYNGDMTEVSIWNTILSQSDISLIKTRAIDHNHPKYTSLVAYYPMNTICGDNLSILQDFSPNNIVGEASNTTVLSVSNLTQLPNFNSAQHFQKQWKANNTTISNLDTLTLSNYDTGYYELILNRNNITISDNWNIDYNISHDTIRTCNSYTALNGVTYTSSINTQYIQDANCDTLRHLYLTILTPTTSTDTQTACGSYTWIDGNTYTTTSNTTTYTIPNTAGCDSIITLDLTIVHDTLDYSIAVDTTGLVLTANESNVNYQWIDCNANTLIPNSTQQTYTATSEGSYAVILSNNVCSDTSECLTVVNTSVLHHAIDWVHYYPNPTNGKVFIALNNTVPNYTIKVIANDGRTLQKYRETQQSNVTIDLTNYPKGVYFIHIVSNEQTSTMKIFKH
ncbi:MAG: T9SS type A sorting domain-containing protein [Flavobacteriales bacterium]|nr:T9SS type A sorting domain-containing protein [Flavobacteriales bacterium]